MSEPTPVLLTTKSTPRPLVNSLILAAWSSVL
jgi:hypothetical protein